MAKALKIIENLYVNMDTVVEFLVDDNSLRLTTNAHPELAFYQIALEGSDAYSEIFVPVNQLKEVSIHDGELTDIDQLLLKYSMDKLFRHFKSQKPNKRLWRQ